MHQSSDSESCDSEDGIRIKTATTRRFPAHYDHFKDSTCETSQREHKDSRITSKSQVSHNISISDKSKNIRKVHDARKIDANIRKSPENDQIGVNSEVCGPVLPPHLLYKTGKSQISSEISSTRKEIQSQISIKELDFCGPALPPHMIKKQATFEESKQSIGPCIPEEFRDILAKSATVLQEENDQDDDCYGPVPLELQNKSKSQVALEERALQIKLNKLNEKSPEQTTREEWMLELPEIHAANLGLAPRQFRTREMPDLSDRSSWTDTPLHKKSKKTETADSLKVNAELQAMRERDAAQEKLAKKARKQRKQDKSLLEQHQAKLKEKRREENDGGVRRPFNREVDLKVNRFDDAQKKSILKKAQLLDDRFSQGQSKFL